MQKTLTCGDCHLKVTVIYHPPQSLDELASSKLKWSKWDGQYKCCTSCSFNRFNGLGEHKKASMYLTVSQESLNPIYRQYSGLTDKNGQQILTGHVVTFGRRTYKVKFEIGSFMLYDKDGEMISKLGGYCDYTYPLSELYHRCAWTDGHAGDIEIVDGF